MFFLPFFQFPVSNLQYEFLLYLRIINLSQMTAVSRVKGLSSITSITPWTSWTACYHRRHVHQIGGRGIHGAAGKYIYCLI